jgi:hypothetical protein
VSIFGIGTKIGLDGRVIQIARTISIGCSLASLSTAHSREHRARAGPRVFKEARHFAGTSGHFDEEVQLLLTAQADNAIPAEIQAELGWDEKKYKAVQKKKRRLVIRLMLEGKLT